MRNKMRKIISTVVIAIPLAIGAFLIVRWIAEFLFYFFAAIRFATD